MIDGAQDLLTSNLSHLNQKRQVWQALKLQGLRVCVMRQRILAVFAELAND